MAIEWKGYEVASERERWRCGVFTKIKLRQIGASVRVRQVARMLQIDAVEAGMAHVDESARHLCRISMQVHVLHGLRVGLSARAAARWARTCRVICC